MMADKKILKIKGNEYEVSFPNVGQFYQIEAMKQNLARGYYNVMMSSPSAAAQQALDMIDVEATLTILCPKLISDLKVKNFSELGILDYKVIFDEYRKQVVPFFNEIQKLLSGGDDLKTE